MNSDTVPVQTKERFHGLRTTARWLWIAFTVLLCFAARWHNLGDVFFEGQIYFLEGDCYSRMTRARMLVEQGQISIRAHAFENHPEGILTHTTMPLDVLIAGLKVGCDHLVELIPVLRTSVLRTQTLDVAGALVSPLLGALTCLMLGIWARGLRLPFAAWGGVPLFFAISPILVHATVLGRPDHQSLILFFVTAAWCLGVRPSDAPVGPVRRGLIAASWACAWWVSLYEPTILLVVTGVLGCVVLGRNPFSRPALQDGLIFVAVLVVAFACDGWRMRWLDGSDTVFLRNWMTGIGELKTPRAGILFAWIGWLGVLAPVLLWHHGRKDQRAWVWLGLVVATGIFTVCQARWGYFFALAYACSLPFQIQQTRGWIVWPLLLISWWPIAADWELRLFPEDEGKSRYERRVELASLRRLTSAMTPQGAGFIAPWWLSPPIAYWSRCHGVAGTSHQSIGGTVATARFYLAEDPQTVRAILDERNVTFVLADHDPDRIIRNSSVILGTPPPEYPMAQRLYDPAAEVRPTAFGPDELRRVPGGYEFLSAKDRGEYYTIFEYLR